MDFFIAPDDETAAQVKGFGTRGAFESLPGGIYDPSEAVVEWDTLFVGTSRQALMQAGEPRIITEITNDGCYVFAVFDRLTTALARADQDERHEAAHQWAHWRQDDGEDISEEEAVAHLDALAALARSAARQGARLYCSVT
ncbi:hypothetical protein ACIRJO_41090 [Streptomyces sp. NPDC102394]|uniref:hypothetical protein n=1 Tax=Streptomyces sp. NPDC102394 TaxID=3366167 RepID=UPI0038001DAA